MKKALQTLALAIAAVILLTAAAAQEMLTSTPEELAAAQPITGVLKRPDGVNAQVSFALRYQYPQFAAANDADRAINRYYQALADDMAQAAVQDEWQEAQITYEVTHNTGRYLSVVQTMTSQSGNGERETISADTFARDGMYAGQPLSLSQVLGLEEDSELSAEWTMAEALAYELVWQMVQSDMQSGDGDYPDGLALEDLHSVFMPETDFYLDQDGNVVFFIQAGELAGEIAGVLRFPFAPAELLSVMHE